MNLTGSGKTGKAFCTCPKPYSGLQCIRIEEFRMSHLLPLARFPLVIRTISDIEKLMMSPKAAKRLPRGGLIITIPGLGESRRNEFQSQVNKYIRACGCAAGGATFLTVSAALIAYVISLAQAKSLVDLFWTILAGLLTL